MNILKERDLEEKLSKKMIYDKEKNNKNNFSYWYSKIKDSGLNIPESVVIPLSFEQFDWLTSDNYTPEAINKFRDELISVLNEKSFNIDRKLFLKTGTFSDKFNFKNCTLDDLNDIGKKSLDIFYSSMCVGAGNNTEIVVREFIDSNIRNNIYNGLPLNTEFRAFYDFNNKKVLDVFNYWDKDTVRKNFIKEDNLRDIIDNLNLSLDEDINKLNKILSNVPSYKVQFILDYISFNKEIDSMEKNFELLKDIVIISLEKHLKNVNLEGIWSVDMMFNGRDFYLIDMAIGKDSYFYNRLKLN